MTTASVRPFPSQVSTDVRLTDWATDHVMARTVFNNFEIADMDLWRGEAYTTFFNHLDQNGGFYYEVCRRYSCEQKS